MSKIETTQDFKKFLKDNKEKLLEKTVKIEDIPRNDEWLNDTSWDKIYAKGVKKSGEV